MPKFRPGDRVRCIDDSGDIGDTNLREGCYYTVHASAGGVVALVGYLNLPGLREERFEAVPKPPADMVDIQEDDGLTSIPAAAHVADLACRLGRWPVHPTTDRAGLDVRTWLVGQAIAGTCYLEMDDKAAAGIAGTAVRLADAVLAQLAKK